jgi:hypothetical protein
MMATSATYLSPVSSVGCFKKYRVKEQAAINIEQFLADSRFSKEGQTCRGVTWLELYTIYRIKGYPKPIADPASPAAQRTTLLKQIACFKKVLRGVVQRSLAAEDQDMFKPGRAVPDALVGVGILGMHAALRVNIYLQDGEKQSVSTKLLNINRTISQKHVDEYLQGKRQVIPHPFKGKGKVSWDSTFPTKSDTRLEGSVWRDRFDEAGAKPPETSFFGCPACEKVEPSTNEKFQTFDLDKKILCKACKKPKPVKDWTCVCGAKWHTCSTHRAYAQCSEEQDASISATAQGQSLGTLTSKPPKRKTCGHGDDYETLLAEDEKRAKQKLEAKRGCKRTGDILLGDRTPVSWRIGPFSVLPKLGPILSQRFGRTPSASSS